MYRILVVDDEDKIRALIRKYAEFEGNQVTEAKNGMEAVTLCRRDPKAFDIIIMDVMMPELDGFSAVAEIRKVCSTPVLMLSARGEEVTAIMNRVRPQAEERQRNVMEFGGLSIDLDGRIVTVDGQRVELSPKEYDLLVYMARNKNIALTREMLITNVWGYDFYGDDRTLDTHIKLLRRSLGPYSGYIVTLRGVGYRFEAP